MAAESTTIEIAGHRVTVRPEAWLTNEGFQAEIDPSFPAEGRAVSIFRTHGGYPNSAELDSFKGIFFVGRYADELVGRSQVATPASVAEKIANILSHEASKK